MLQETLVLMKNMRETGYTGSLPDYEKKGGYTAYHKVITKMQPQELTEEVVQSGLRGRGGAGFPTGMKWKFMAKKDGVANYLVANADEGEPGTFKDREILLRDPHLFLEGMMMACYAVGCNVGYIYIRGEYYEAIKILQQEIDALKAKKYLGQNIFGSKFSLNLVIHPGAGSYICGEETALLDSLEGKRGLPRIKPPFPAQAGFNGCPTSVNNVETLANLPTIIQNGIKAFQANGSPNNAGTRIVSLSGVINRPGAYEIKMGSSLKEIIYDLGQGMPDGKKLKAVIPGGSSTPILTAQEIDIPYDFDSLAKAGSMMGSAGIIVIDDSVDMPEMLERLISFYAHESCGQCTPCREGMNWMRVVLRKLRQRELEKNWVEQIERIAQNILGNTLCALGDAGAMPTLSFIKKFRSEFLAYCR